MHDLSADAPPRYWIDRLDGEEDLSGVLAVEEETFTNPWTRDMYIAELGNGETSRVYYARMPDGAVIGFCSCWLVTDELHINNLAVLPAYRRQGVASALLRHMFEQARLHGAVRATLEGPVTDARQGSVIHRI